MNSSDNENRVSIQWESTGYTVLKNLSATVLGIFCEFIDNSIQSYTEEKNEILKIDPHYMLKIKISYDGREIRIKDNAGGIDTKNFKRALKPANRPDNTDGLNEFGMGMKYAAVWISNEWELKSSALGEDIERNVVFNYEKVVRENLIDLPIKESPADREEHYTEVILRQLETKHVYPWQEKYLKNKIAYIYRNFIRRESIFFSNWKEDYIELEVFGEVLKWHEYGFLKQQWWRDRQVDFIGSDIQEWKYKIDWMEIPYKEEVRGEDGITSFKESIIEISGFVGILPDGEHSGKNGFVLFRRGRAIEGLDSRIYPVDISGRSARAFKYIRLYGELHFRNVDISFDKTKLSINKERRDEIFAVIAGLIKHVVLNEGDPEYNLIQQADKHRASFSRPNANKAIETYHEKIKGTQKNSQEDELKESEAADRGYGDKYEEDLKKIDKSAKNKILGEKDEISTTKIGSFEYRTVIKFSKNIDNLYIVNYTKEDLEIIITINLEHDIFLNNPNLYDAPSIGIIVGMIKCMGISEIKGLQSGNEAKHLRYAFNDYISLILK